MIDKIAAPGNWYNTAVMRVVRSLERPIFKSLHSLEARWSHLTTVTISQSNLPCKGKIGDPGMEETMRAGGTKTQRKNPIILARFRLKILLKQSLFLLKKNAEKHTHSQNH